jgi:tRNA pseudouridine13 synthase
MSFDPLTPPPLLTSDLPGIRGKIKQLPEDFEVEEIPAYEPRGQGEFLYLWVEKRDMGADYFFRQIARRLDIPVNEVGSAGMKDRHAVTQQMISVPAFVEDRLAHLEGDGIRLLKVSRHGNKLRPGHLHGNRFRILIRNVNSTNDLPALVERLRSLGLPNYYGPQRFGRDGETVQLGLALLRGGKGSGVFFRPPPLDTELTKPVPRPEKDSRPLNRRLSPWLRRLALSAAQSALFNHYLGRRLADGLFRRVLPGDVMAKWPYGGLFVAEDVPREQARFDVRETVTTGPMFGRKMFSAGAEAQERELAVLADAGLTASSFGGFGKLLQGTRRRNLVYLDDLQVSTENEGVRLCVSLPAGCYATVLLREFMKNGEIGDDEPDSTM